jgi:hypothetical protein
VAEKRRKIQKGAENAFLLPGLQEEHRQLRTTLLDVAIFLWYQNKTSVSQ